MCFEEVGSYFLGFKVRTSRSTQESSGSMNLNDIYRITSIGRPLDPHYPSNRLVLMLLPAAAAVAGTIAFLRDDVILEILEAALLASVVALGSWALARELAPDVHSVAFVSMVLALGIFLTVESSSILILVVALLLVRIVNRTVGLPARVTDSVLVVSITAWLTYDGPFPWLGLIGVLAFALDASLEQRLLHQWVFSGVCLVVAGLSFYRHGPYLLEESLSRTMVILLTIIAVGYVLRIWRTRVVKSLSDATGSPLYLSRVRAGMLVAFWIGLQALTQGQFGIETSSLVWATLAGVSLGGVRFLQSH